MGGNAVHTSVRTTKKNCSQTEIPQTSYLVSFMSFKQVAQNDSVFTFSQMQSWWQTVCICLPNFSHSCSGLLMAADGWESCSFSVSCCFLSLAAAPSGFLCLQKSLPLMALLWNCSTAEGGQQLKLNGISGARGDQFEELRQKQGVPPSLPHITLLCFLPTPENNTTRSVSHGLLNFFCINKNSVAYMYMWFSIQHY